MSSTDLHQAEADRLGIPRGAAKLRNHAAMYGGSDPRFAHHAYLQVVADEDVRFLVPRDVSYGASWKMSGGRSAWFMLKRKMDRLTAMLARPRRPEGFSEEDERHYLHRMSDEDADANGDVNVQADHWSWLLRLAAAEDIFELIIRGPGGEDGTVLAEVRDLRRYLLLVEAEMVAVGAVEAPVPCAPLPADELGGEPWGRIARQRELINSLRAENATLRANGGRAPVVIGVDPAAGPERTVVERDPGPFPVPEAEGPNLICSAEHFTGARILRMLSRALNDKNPDDEGWFIDRLSYDTHDDRPPSGHVTFKQTVPWPATSTTVTEPRVPRRDEEDTRTSVKTRPAPRLEDGLVACPPLGHFISVSDTGGGGRFWNVDRRYYPREQTDHLPHLRLELNHHEWAGTLPEYRGMYYWSPAGEGKYVLQGEYHEHWGRV